MKIYNGKKTCQSNKFSLAVQKKVVALVFWVSDIQQRQESITYTNWTHPQLVLSVQEL